MKAKLLSIVVASTFILVGCQGTENQEGRTDDPNNNMEQTRNVDDFDQNRNMNNRDNLVTNRDRDRNRSNIDNVNNRDNEYSVSDEAADKIVDEIAEIDSAYVLTTNNNAYVAAMLDNDGNRAGKQHSSTGKDATNKGEQLTDDVKSRISEIVQSVDHNIDNVYVTTNPDFMDLTDNYINDMNDGKPVRGFFDEIGNMIERVFPQNKR